jgi:hypothetical protein
VSHTNILSAWVDSASWVSSMEYRLGHVPPSQGLVSANQAVVPACALVAGALPAEAPSLQHSTVALSIS